MSHDPIDDLVGQQDSYYDVLPSTLGDHQLTLMNSGDVVDDYYAEYMALLDSIHQDENRMELDSPKPLTISSSSQSPTALPVKAISQRQPKYYERDPSKIFDPVMKKKIQKAIKSRSYRVKKKHDAAKNCIGLCELGKTLSEVFDNLKNRARGDPVAEEMLSGIMEQIPFDTV